MAVPDFQSMMLPFLEFHKDGQPHHSRDSMKYIIERHALTDQDVNEPVPSGSMTKLKNRLSWAGVYLRKAGLLAKAGKGVNQITDEGKRVLSNPPDRISVKYLMQFPLFVEFKQKKNDKDISDNSHDEANGGTADELSTITPVEMIETGYQNIRQQLADEIIERIMGCSPVFFERLVVELIVAMGYGGSIKDAGRAVGRGGDGGIDGIIKEDKLGLDIIYIQAKRWDNTVGRPEIQKFAGALMGRKAKKGIFITTSSFSKDAREFAEDIDSKIVLIDGSELAELMIDHNIGVARETVYEVKRIDSDYFEEDIS